VGTAREARVQNNTEEAMVGTEKSMWVPDTICHLERGGGREEEEHLFRENHCVLDGETSNPRSCKYSVIRFSEFSIGKQSMCPKM